jgi:KDO2-lipid IV(A) lauroyltransferase
MPFYFLYKLGYILANILPLNVGYWLAERFSDAQYYLAKKDREAVAQNLNIVLKKEIKECRKLAQKVFRNFGLYMVDFFRMARLDIEFVRKHVDIIGLENIDTLLGQKKGVIVLTCHIGNWEMGGVVMAIMGYDISAVALNHAHKSINEFFIRQREKGRLKVIPVSSVMKRCVSTLLRKGILALLGDRDFTDSGIVLDFFGVPTSIPKGPAVLSLKTCSPIVPGFFIRQGRTNYTLIFDKPIEVGGGLVSEEEGLIKQTTERFIPVMEKYIRTYPEQWLIFRRFWETPVDAFVL